MSKVIDDLLNPWMVALHGTECKSLTTVRLATLAYCASIPKMLSKDLSQLPDGSSSVEISVGPRAPEHNPPQKEASNPIEELLLDNDEGLTVRIDLPKAYDRANHLKGGSVFKNLTNKEMDCDMEMALDGDVVILEVYHRYYQRYVIFRIS